MKASLSTYRRKRHASATPEPRGKVSRRKGDLYVIQKHSASTLHYDVRLQLDGVLKSWAVPKGPSLDPKDKRLAIEVEDHPVEYADFEGNIPEGEYGAGTVIVWDRGTWSPDGDPHQGLRRGNLKFDLHGEKLRGSWVLIATQQIQSKSARSKSSRSKQRQWLLIKVKDGDARPRDEFDVTAERPASVASGRSLDETADKAPAKKPRKAGKGKQSKNSAATATASKAPRGSVCLKLVAGAKRAAMPQRVELELAALAAKPPEGDGWLSEIKLDGYRIVCHVAGGAAALYTRTHQDWTARFAAVAAAASKLPVKQAILDGEVAVYLPDGRTSFQALQNEMREDHEGSLTYSIFDLLYLDGHDLRAAALEDRKRLLEEILRTNRSPHLQYLEHVVGQAGRFYKECCKRGLEGSICKRRTRPYLGGRTADWLKAKCLLRQEFVIGGFTDSTNKRLPFGALLVGYHEKAGNLKYAGRVGTGWQSSTMDALARQLGRLARRNSPFDSPVDRSNERIHWVQPRLVAEIAFSQWTRDGRLRQPSFQGLREDKPAENVVREEAT